MATLTQLHETHMGGDFRDFFINGSAIYDYSIPGTNCSKCGKMWAYLQITTFECPDEIREEMADVVDAKPNMPWEELSVFISKWERKVIEYYPNARLLPGFNLQPIKWDIPSYPESDVYFKMGSVIVRDNVKQVIEKNRFTGLCFFSVLLGQVGELKESEIILEDEIDMEEDVIEPGDLLAAAPKLDDLNDVGIFFNAITEFDAYRDIKEKESRVTKACDFCGYVRYDLPQERQEEYEYYNLNKFIPEKYVPDYDIFDSHIHRGWLMRPEVYEALKTECDLRNCEVHEIKVVNNP
ncbi:hypothetical protein Pla110_13570 [Polystyrenella longa]|uniref:Uncharacterized protein n=1 Tax=Polystyrenella longa TaxID=2528007 RepID=A0A518CK90_9PLAN|nr:hypothetical protein [Polystyrenella longa]QDU79646.1 hypothetical protein Pla110_13570 [Polystyrenella longa]